MTAQAIFSNINLGMCQACFYLRTDKRILNVTTSKPEQNYEFYCRIIPESDNHIGEHWEKKKEEILAIYEENIGSCTSGKGWIEVHSGGYDPSRKFMKSHEFINFVPFDVRFDLPELLQSKYIHRMWGHTQPLWMFEQSTLAIRQVLCSMLVNTLEKQKGTFNLPIILTRFPQYIVYSVVSW